MIQTSRRHRFVEIDGEDLSDRIEWAVLTINDEAVTHARLTLGPATDGNANALADFAFQRLGQPVSFEIRPTRAARSAANHAISGIVVMANRWEALDVTGGVSVDARDTPTPTYLDPLAVPEEVRD